MNPILVEDGIHDVPEEDTASLPLVQNDPWLPLVQDAADIITEKLPPIVEIVKGIIAEQSKLVIGSGSKSFKTWVTMDMALSIAHEVLWLGRETNRRRVLYVNLELKSQTFKRRLQTIAKAKGITVDREWFLHLPLRGKMASLTVFGLVSRIILFAQHFKIGVIVIDPVYKMNLEGEENNSRDQTLFFNQLDRITTEASCTLILNDHFGKGNQSEKDPLDAIRGSSAKGGDVDAAMVLRKHEVEGCLRVDMVHRELPPVEPFCIGWKFPLMELRPDLDADKMKKAKGGRSKVHDPEKLCAAIAETTVNNPISISAWAKAAGINRTTLNEYLPGLRAKGWIATAGEGNTARQYLTEKGQLTAKRARVEA
jgi:predicted transcriptional regulator